MAFSTDQKNSVIKSMMSLLDLHRGDLILENQKDLEAYDPADRAMYDRLIVDEKKVDSMIASLSEVLDKSDPTGVIIDELKRPNGLTVSNRTTAFGTILIIYESRPDVTVEAAVLAFKAGNKILLKGGKEAKHSNAALVSYWHEALEENDLDKDWIQFLKLSRQETQDYLKNPSIKLDLIVPRGGEKLIQFVKEHATCAVLISGRGNNFLYVHRDADWEMAKRIILNAKISKISACNALDKVLIDFSITEVSDKIIELKTLLSSYEVDVLLGSKGAELISYPSAASNEVWGEEFLSMKIMIEIVENSGEAIFLTNKHSGGHSASIITNNQQVAQDFMDGVDCAAVYHNASTRFTDGGELGAGAELAISTDKLHHRGPLGLQQLVTNKYYVFGEGQVR